MTTEVWRSELLSAREPRRRRVDPDANHRPRTAEGSTAAQRRTPSCERKAHSSGPDGDREPYAKGPRRHRPRCSSVAASGLQLRKRMLAARGLRIGEPRTDNLVHWPSVSNRSRKVLLGSWRQDVRCEQQRAAAR